LAGRRILLEGAQDDATVLAIRAQEEAGLDIITDGETRRESYSNRFATALEGVDIDHPARALDRSGHPNPVPRIVGRCRRKHAVEVDDLLFPQNAHEQARQDDRARSVHHVAAGAERLSTRRKRAAMDYARP
jgi:methionine synthase II (cobalamin-independent)